MDMSVKSDMMQDLEDDIILSCEKKQGEER